MSDSYGDSQHQGTDGGRGRSEGGRGEGGRGRGGRGGGNLHLTEFAMASG